MGHRRYWMLIGMLVATACPAWAEVDRILGVESGVGVPTELTPEDVSALIGAGSAGLDAQFNAPNGNRFTGATEARKFELRDSGGTNGMNCYWHTAGRMICKPVVANVEGAADIYIENAAGKKWGLKDSGGNIDFEYDEATGTISAMSVSCANAGVNCTSYRRLPGCGGDLVGVDPASGTAGHIWNKSPTATAPTAVAQIGANVNKGVARHPDADGTYGVQLRCRLPANVTIGQVNGVLTWISAGTGNYRPQIKTKCYADNASSDQSFNAAQVFTVAAGTATNPQIDTLNNLTMTGCSAGHILTFELVRSRTEASDTGSSTFDVESFELWATITE